MALAICCLAQGPVCAAEPEAVPARESSVHDLRLDSRYLRSIVDDTVYVLKSPMRFGEEEWRHVALFAGVTTALIAYDRDIQRWSQRNKINKWLPTYREDHSDRVARWVKPLGDFDQVALPLAAFYLYGQATDDQQATQAVLLGIKALIVSNVIGQSLKYVINRRRPSGWGIHHDWGPDSWSDPNRSMPSGHAINVFALATVFSDVYGDRKWVPPVAYGLAALTAASRVHENRHWASDVLVGAGIGYFTARTILDRNLPDRLTVTPMVNGESLGVALQYRF